MDAGKHVSLHSADLGLVTLVTMLPLEDIKVVPMLSGSGIWSAVPSRLFASAT